MTITRMAKRPHYLVFAPSIAIGLMIAITAGHAAQPDTATPGAAGKGAEMMELFGSPAAIVDGEKRADAILANAGIDAVIGGAGYYMDKLEQLLQLIPGALVERISDTVILLRFDAEFVFRKKSASINKRGRTSVNQVGRLLTNFKKTAIVVQVFTNSAGKEKDNQRRSARRAKTVRHHLERHAIDKARIVSLGYGGSYPVASNASARKRNQRVDILLKAKGR